MNQKKRVLIVDEMHESILPLLKGEDYDPVYLPIISRTEILEIIKDFHGLFIRSKTTVDAELVDKAPKLEFVARAGAGLDKIDEEYLRAKDIVIVNAPEGNRDSLAEHTLGILLSVLHRLNCSFDQVKKSIWEREGNRGIELNGKVVGIYGVGYMGKAFSKKLSGMGCRVIGYDKYHHSFEDEFIKEVTISEFLSETEILSIHVPLTEETRFLFNKTYLEKFDKLKVIVNTARGEILRLGDLVELIEENKIYGAALDVLENEKLNTYSDQEIKLLTTLTSFPNVIITPHIGGWTFESYERINEVLVDKLRKAFRK